LFDAGNLRKGREGSASIVGRHVRGGMESIEQRESLIKTDGDKAGGAVKKILKEVMMHIKLEGRGPPNIL